MFQMQVLRTSMDYFVVNFSSSCAFSRMHIIGCAQLSASAVIGVAGPKNRYVLVFGTSVLPQQQLAELRQQVKMLTREMAS